MFRKILVALDNTDSNQPIFENALTLAKATNAQLLLLHVLAPFDQGYPSPIFPGADGTYPTIHTEAVQSYMQQWQRYEHEGQERLRSLTETAVSAGIAADFTQSFGSAGQVICTIAQNWGAELIVMGRRGRTGLSELVLGSTSNYVTHRAPCSVMVVQGLDRP